MAFDKKQYQKDYMRKKRMEELGEPFYKWETVTPTLMEELKSHGRGVPVNGYVLIANGNPDSFGGVVTEEAWRARLDWTCKHGREGWSCKGCLK